MILIAASAALCGCKTAGEVVAYDYVCVKHGTHHLRDRAQTAECFGFPLADYGDIRFFTQAGTARTPDEYGATRIRVTDEVENEIVDIIMDTVKSALGRSIKRHWHFDRISVPAVFREFRHDEGPIAHIAVRAAMHKTKLAPGAIVKFLPLEYKMDLIDREEKMEAPAK